MEEVAPTVMREGGSERRKRHWKILLALLALAFVLRLFLVASPEVIRNDGTEYVRQARQFLLGNLSEGRSPPLYPLLIAGVQMITRDFEMAGIWVSVIFGTLLVLPLFYLGRAVFNETVGIVSALLGAVHPFLYVAAGSVLTESPYYFFFATSVVLGWYTFTTAGLRSLLLFGFSTTLAYLTRPEAIGIPIVFSAWTLFTNPPDQKRPLAKRIAIILIVGISFLAFSFPYLYQIRKDTGAWGFSKKATISLGSLSSEEAAPSLQTLRKIKGVTLSSLIKHPLAVLGRMGAGVLVSLYTFFYSYNPILFFLGLVGWVFLFKRGSPDHWKGNLFLLAHLIFYFGFVFPFFFIAKRYTSQMVPISIPWAALGFLESTEWLHRRWGKGVSSKTFSILLGVFLLTGLFIQGAMTHAREHRTIRKEAGLWMKDHLPRETKIMSRLPQEAFYAELPWVLLPKKSYEDVLTVARFSGVQYLIVDEDIEQDSPGFLRDIKEEDLILLKDLKTKNRSMAIYKIVYSK